MARTRKELGACKAYDAVITAYEQEAETIPSDGEEALLTMLAARFKRQLRIVRENQATAEALGLESPT